MTPTPFRQGPHAYHLVRVVDSTQIEDTDFVETTFTELERMIRSYAATYEHLEIAGELAFDAHVDTRETADGELVHIGQCSVRVTLQERQEAAR